MTTVFYTQEQVNEIGAAIRKELDENNQKIKDDVQKLIDNMQPVAPTEPTEPTTGTGGDTGNGGGRMFLDDGREIKTKLFEFTVGYSQYQYELHGISQEIIGGSCLINGFTPNHNSEKHDYTFMIGANDIGVQLRVSDSSLLGGKAKVLITYLA